MEWRNNEVNGIAMPTSGQARNISFAEPAAEPAFEVTSLCNRIGAGVQRKEFMSAIGILGIGCINAEVKKYRSMNAASV
jgi:hypothetical protein